MFCPQCGAEEHPDQNYCRQCKLALSAVRLAMEGRVDEALKKLKEGESTLRKGFIIFGILILATIIAAIRSGPFEIAVWPLTFQITHWWVALICSILFGIPVILVGLARLLHAKRLLDPRHQKNSLAVGGTGHEGKPLHSAPRTLTENTTLELKPTEQVHQRPPE